MNGRDRYEFKKVSPAGEGCRFWVYTIISDLEKAGVVPGGSGLVAWDAVSMYWRYPEGCEPRAVTKGTFY